MFEMFWPSLFRTTGAKQEKLTVGIQGFISEKNKAWKRFSMTEHAFLNDQETIPDFQI